MTEGKAGHNQDSGEVSMSDTLEHKIRCLPIFGTNKLLMTDVIDTVREHENSAHEEAKALVGELVTRLMSYRTGVATSSALMEAWDTARPLVLEAPDSTLAREVFEMALDSIEEEASETITKATNWLEGK